MPIFEIAPLNPLKFVTSGTDRIDDNFESDLVNIYQSPRCYLQKWQFGDVGRVQVLSDYVFTFKVLDLDTGAEIADFVPSLKSSEIVGESFSVYEIEIDFSALGSGSYYCKILYNDTFEDKIVLSEPFEVSESWPGSILFEFVNSENNFDVVFETGIDYQIRVEGVIDNFTPESDDVIYNDMLKNATLLNSVPFRSFTLFVGGAPGVPVWMADKINRVMACDSVKIDGGSYEKKQGAGWEVKRADEYQFVGINIEIVPSENRFNRRLKIAGSGGGGTEGNINTMQKIEQFNDVSGSLTVSGKMKDKSLLEKICIVRSGVGFNLRIGTTPGGDEIAEFQITDLVTTILINWLFESATTIYLTGISSVSYMAIIYKQLDETGTPGGGAASTVIGKGATVIFRPEDAANLDANFSLSTGLGVTGSDWAGWAIADGRNGTVDWGGLVPVGYKFGDPTFGAEGDEGGEAQTTLTEAQIPSHSHEYKNAVGSAYKRGNTGTAFFDNGNNTSKTTELTGGGEAHNNLQPYRVAFYVTKIA
jgi:hypothetical protein